MKPHCENFKPDPVANWLCAWWDYEQIGWVQRMWFCSRPDWEERICETYGRRNWEQGLSGPVGINVARLLGIELPDVGEHPERALVENVNKLDTDTEG